MVERILEMDPGNPRASQNKVEFERQLATGYSREPPLDSHRTCNIHNQSPIELPDLDNKENYKENYFKPVGWRVSYEGLCRGELAAPTGPSTGLECFFKVSCLKAFQECKHRSEHIHRNMSINL